MTLIIAAIIILIGLVIHAVISYAAMHDMQREQNRNSRAIQLSQQQHEVSFAENQARMFREANAKKSQPS